MSCFEVNINEQADTCLCDLDISITSLDPPMDIEIKNIEEVVDVNITSLITNIQYSISDQSPTIQCEVIDITEYTPINIEINCSINEEQILQFENEKLTWRLEDVAEIKYNTLISTGYWHLEEIEELL